MKHQGNSILKKFLKYWRFRLVLETILYGFGAAILMYFMSQDILLSILTLIGVVIIASLFVKPWKANLPATTHYLDAKLPNIEYSSSLLLATPNTLTDLAKLQRIKISKQLETSIKSIQPPGRLSQSIITAAVLILIGFMMHLFNLTPYFDTTNAPMIPENAIIFKGKDSVQTSKPPPTLTDQWVTIRFPDYTNMKSITSSNMDLKVLEGSQVFWKLAFDADVKSVSMESMGSNYQMTFKDGHYNQNKTLSNSGFYNFKFHDLLDNQYTSDLYAIDIFKDESPTIKIQGIKQFTGFNYDDDQTIRFNTLIDDDFGVGDAHIIATVSKGTGESVKFRELKLEFENKINPASKKQQLTKTINLSEMNMEPGDELYFYVEVSDLKQPIKNTSRSETYFAAIKDTTSYQFGVEGTLGINRMPDYFRSQRQLIIDTEKLITEKSTLNKDVFKSRSNELGYDQKALRLKYGEFMGVEEDSGLDIQEESPGQEAAIDNADPLAEYTHDHDGDNEHNLVDTEDKEKDKTAKNPLQAFMHDHGDPEMASLFEESLKAKMHKAMSEMWDAELYLRLYEPNKSLPYQYKALKLIQEIKNHARIYVHRIGFDPPPIKEDKRLTGKLDQITSFRKNEDILEKDTFVNMRLAIQRLEQNMSTNPVFTQKDMALFEQAATELSFLAVEFPGKHLKTLQQLKNISEGINISQEIVQETRRGLLLALPNPKGNPSKLNDYLNDIDLLLIKALEANDK